MRWISSFLVFPSSSCRRYCFAIWIYILYRAMGRRAFLICSFSAFFVGGLIQHSIFLNVAHVADRFPNAIQQLYTRIFCCRCCAARRCLIPLVPVQPSTSSTRDLRLTRRFAYSRVVLLRVPAGVKGQIPHIIHTSQRFFNSSVKKMCWCATVLELIIDRFKSQ